MWDWLNKLVCAIAGHKWKSEPPYRVCGRCGKKEEVPTPGPTPGPTPEPTPKPGDPIVVPPEYSGRRLVFPMDEEREGDNVVNVGGFDLKCLSNDEKTGGPKGEKDVWITQQAVKAGAVKWTLQADGSILMAMKHFTTKGGKKLRLEGLIPVSDSQGRPLQKTVLAKLAKDDQRGTCRAYWTRVE